MGRFVSIQAVPRRQAGAVLYVALIILILLSLIGIVGMRVSGMQERMSANYMRTNEAFQIAERDARAVEADIQAAIDGASGSYPANQEACSPVFDPLTWAESVTAGAAVHTRRIDKCFAASSLKLGEKQNEQTGNIYEITVLSSDDPANATATAVIDTIFIP